LTETSFDRSAANLAWSPDSKVIYFGAENETLEPIYEMAPRAAATPKKLIDGFNGAVSISAGRGKRLFCEDEFDYASGSFYGGEDCIDATPAKSFAAVDWRSRIRHDAGGAARHGGSSPNESKRGG